jgi:hypothetical protein
MAYVLTTCTVVLGKEREFETTLNEITAIYQKHGAKPIGFWWTLGGERNEAVWLFAWNDVRAYENGQEKAVQDENYPLEQVASLVITSTDKILKPQKALEHLTKT